MTECLVPSIPLPLTFHPEGPDALAGTIPPSPPPSCSSGLAGAAITTCQNYAAWSRHSATAADIVGAATTIICTEVGKSHSRHTVLKVYNACTAVHALLTSINTEFNGAIVDVNAGKKYAPVGGAAIPTPMPPIPDNGTKSSTAKAAITLVWAILKPVLIAALSKCKGTPLEIALSGLILGMDKALATATALLIKYA